LSAGSVCTGLPWWTINTFRLLGVGHFASTTQDAAGIVGVAVRRNTIDQRAVLARVLIDIRLSARWTSQARLHIERATRLVIVPVEAINAS
jgi:hypothetical protein